MISVRLSGRPAVRMYPNFNVGLYSHVMRPTFLKLDMMVTTIELYPMIPVLVTFDLYLGHKVTV